MKTKKDLLDESRERAKARFAERKEIEAKSFSVRCEARRANVAHPLAELGLPAVGNLLESPERKSLLADRCLLLDVSSPAPQAGQLEIRASPRVSHY